MEIHFYNKLIVLLNKCDVLNQNNSHESCSKHFILNYNIYLPNFYCLNGFFLNFSNMNIYDFVSLMCAGKQICTQ